MSAGEVGLFAVEPVVSYPCRARPGERYLLTIDLRPAGSPGEWPYPGEEYVVHCLLDTLPLFEHEPLGDGAVVLHRFGGTYGPAAFLLTAAAEEMAGTIRVTLVNGWGVPVQVLDLSGIEVKRQAPSDGRQVHLRGARGPGPTTSGGRDWAREAPRADSPYAGLNAFTGEDTDLFFGREREVEELRSLLTKVDVVALVGDSGTGKSSLLRAGLGPRVQRQGLDVPREWHVVTARPGERPAESLAAALLRLGGRELDLLSEEMEDPDFLLREAFWAGRPLLLLFDQFEEMFTLCRDEVQRRAAVELLANLLDQRRYPVRVVLALRSGYLTRTQELRLGRYFTPYELRPLEPESLRRVIVEPVARLRYTFEAATDGDGSGPRQGLLERILADTRPLAGSGDPEPVPLAFVQELLQQLWLLAEGRNSRELRHEDYDRLGGLSGCIVRHAESVYEQLSGDKDLGPAREDLVARALTELVGEGGARRLRRREDLEGELNSLPAPAVVDRLVGQRLLTLRRNPDGDGPAVEVAHDVLIQQWLRLRCWLTGDEELIYLNGIDGVTGEYAVRPFWLSDVIALAQQEPPQSPEQAGRFRRIAERLQRPFL
jgi:hypothetical protein